MLSNIYNRTITILNKYKRADNGSYSDLWYKTVLTDCAWYNKSIRAVNSQNVAIGNYIEILIPFGNEIYTPYIDWKNGYNQEDSFTLSVGDYIVLGEVEEDITAENVIKIMQTYEPNVCSVKQVEELYHRFGANIRLKVEGY